MTGRGEQTPVVTMRDVAQVAGVSQAAVSYAYNRPGKLSEAQRERIFQVAEELGYIGPHATGRSLRTGQVGALGLMITDSLPYAFDDPATAALLKGISEVGELSEVALTLLPCPLESDRMAQGSGILLRGLVDGFLAYAMPHGHPAVETALRRKLPVVIIDGPNPGGLPRVGIRDREAAREAAEHVLSLGHRSIGILVDRLLPDGYGGPVTPARRRAARDLVMKERLAGYAAAFRSAGVPWSSATIIEAGGFHEAASQSAAASLLDSEEVTAVLATTDVLAFATIGAARRRGLRIPRDLSVIGFDDLPTAAAAELSTVRQPLVDKGREAARLLLDVIEGAQPREIILPTDLVLRATTAPPPGS
ncbi:LacI family DNA-binding transcriptional regulator [Streptomyces sp. NEAU-YJ-81]|uniref:LacI family DNA-binding transcriptional regulator n=1 Tax=Streptomyces sp. NEAU-YJ-81 TaxID=2820288 RepID=UPI001ABC599E|nr:LacI family DNA-binding transcriptional regulator [Streptomyces sp. NEAU-YJ-81]MBO3682141.1 LacI family DNA-binding transcriptional regulator [Streptomyces sp. NEAU-YJ-81]